MAGVAPGLLLVSPSSQENTRRNKLDGDQSAKYECKEDTLRRDGKVTNSMD